VPAAGWEGNQSQGSGPRDGRCSRKRKGTKFAGGTVWKGDAPRHTQHSQGSPLRGEKRKVAGNGIQKAREKLRRSHRARVVGEIKG